MVRASLYRAHSGEMCIQCMKCITHEQLPNVLIMQFAKQNRIFIKIVLMFALKISILNWNRPKTMIGKWHAFIHANFWPFGLWSLANWFIRTTNVINHLQSTQMFSHVIPKTVQNDDTNWIMTHSIYNLPIFDLIFRSKSKSNVFGPKFARFGILILINFAESDDELTL